MEWITTSWSTVGVLAVKAVVAYVAMVAFVRISGLRSFAKMSSFDFAVTVAFGSVLASVVLAPEPPLAQVLLALVLLFGLQAIVAQARVRTTLDRLIDNSPLLLMAGSDILDDNLRAAEITREDLAKQLRAANVMYLDDVRAVVMETTGEITVLTGGADGRPPDSLVMLGVRDAELVR